MAVAVFLDEDVVVELKCVVIEDLVDESLNSELFVDVLIRTSFMFGRLMISKLASIRNFFYEKF